MKVIFRTLQQLGRQLISSDAVAVNELIKNAIDADASTMEIAFFDDKVVLTDNGRGISYDKLKAIGESISISDKIDQHGDKGLGRLAMQSIGKKVEIKTWRNEKAFCQQVDWSVLDDPGKDISTFNFETKRIEKKEIKHDFINKFSSGTSITISGLLKIWKKENVESFINYHYKKFFNVLKNRKPIDLKFRHDDNDLPIQKFPLELKRDALASFHMKYLSSEGKISYTVFSEGKVFEKEKKTLSFNEIINYFTERKSLGEKLNNFLEGDLRVINDASILKQVGDFEMDMHWFNRRGLREEFKKNLDSWNTIALYRDNIMVHPYGTRSNDWLSIDASAFARKGYKFNRQQLIGAVSISKKNNGGLEDATDREKLIRNNHYEAFMILCYYFINACFFDIVEKFQIKGSIRKRQPSREEGLMEELQKVKCEIGLLPCRILMEITKLSFKNHPTIITCSLRTLLEACLKYEFDQPHNKKIKQLWEASRKPINKNDKYPRRLSDIREFLQAHSNSKLNPQLHPNLNPDLNPNLRKALGELRIESLDFMNDAVHGNSIVSSPKAEDMLLETFHTISIIASGEGGKDNGR